MFSVPESRVFQLPHIRSSLMVSLTVFGANRQTLNLCFSTVEYKACRLHLVKLLVSALFNAERSASEIKIIFIGLCVN